MNAAKQFINFINKSPSPFHAVDECRTRLLQAGFRELKETEQWELKPQDKCFVTRNQSSVIAFAVGGKYKPGNGFSVVGAHTDSPCLKVKPFSARTVEGYLQVGVQTYGGGLWTTWFDRDLKLAGRVMVKTVTGFSHRLVHINRPILAVPNLCVHFSRAAGTEMKIDPEEHFSAILATQAGEQLSGKKSSDDKSSKHHPVMLELIAKQLDCDVDNIYDFELYLADCQDAAVGGVYDEFIHASRLDNLISCYTSLMALIESSTDTDGLGTDENIRLITLFDNEEVGSNSAQGAGSSLTELILRRIVVDLDNDHTNLTAYEQAIPKSLVLSCDVSHAIHPNYKGKHEMNHKPAFHKGMVIKIHANQRYATTAITSTMFKAIAEEANLPIQEFCIRQDMACGSTIGPITSSKLGIPVIDIGPPLLSMHSIRETCDVTSIQENIDLFKTFFNRYSAVYKTFTGI